MQNLEQFATCNATGYVSYCVLNFIEATPAKLY